MSFYARRTRSEFNPLGDFSPVITLSGTITGTITESDIVTGGKTIILTLANDTWVASGATFDAQRQNILDGLDSGYAEATGWNAVVQSGAGVGSVVRTSSTVVTITLPALATYDISYQEWIIATIPSTALTGGVAGVASPGFTVDVAAAPATNYGYLLLLGVG